MDYRIDSVNTFSQYGTDCTALKRVWRIGMLQKNLTGLIRAKAKNAKRFKYLKAALIS
jgi:hypothetical protein